MSNSLQTFQFHNFNLEVIEKDGELWFIANPLAKFLGYQNPAEALRTNVDDEDIEKIYIPIKSNNYVCVNESGLYSLVIRSNKPEAKSFKRWVTHEVLPSIRKQGYYAKPGALPFSDVLPELPPVSSLDSALLSELRRISPSLAQVYLLEKGVTPEYVQQQMERLGPSAIGLANHRVVPFEILKLEIPLQFERQDDKYFYFTPGAFARLCGDYDATATARMLRDRQLLGYYRHTLKIKAPRNLFLGRPMVYAIKKTIVEA